MRRRAGNRLEAVVGAAQEIPKIRGMVNQVSFHYNLLPLNAAVEAGAGFSVVAEMAAQVNQENSPKPLNCIAPSEISRQQSSKLDATTGHMQQFQQITTGNAEPAQQTSAATVVTGLPAARLSSQFL